MKKSQLYNQAVLLRRRGYSYKTIHLRLGISKSTAYKWLCSIQVSRAGLRRLRQSEEQGRIRGRQTLANQKRKRDTIIARFVSESIEGMHFNATERKVLCALLYWAEGSKGGNKLAFTNSDPVMIQVFMKLLRESFKREENRIYVLLNMHDYHIRTTQVAFF